MCPKLEQESGLLSKKEVKKIYTGFCMYIYSLQLPWGIKYFQCENRKHQLGQGKQNIYGLNFNTHL